MHSLPFLGPVSWNSRYPTVPENYVMFTILFTIDSILIEFESYILKSLSMFAIIIYQQSIKKTDLKKYFFGPVIIVTFDKLAREFIRTTQSEFGDGDTKTNPSSRVPMSVFPERYPEILIGHLV